MNWLEPHDGLQSSACGYRVAAVRLRDAWRYSAFGPLLSPDLNYWQWLNQADAQITYAIGCQVPMRRLLLGVFPAASQARACCEAHAQSQETPHV